jgi:hypothetical protein
MNTPDEFSLYHDDLLEGDYDCVDRMVLRFSMRIFRSVRPVEVYATGGDNCAAMTLRWMMRIYVRWPVPIRVG